MSQKMFQGRTANHLSWVMVDSTDFATPESAMSAAAKIMVNGKLQSTSLVYFVSSGTGSMLGGDIKHVGASATGVYTVALAKADLSDASAAWYDQYIFTITATGAAQQVLVCEGIMDHANVSNISDYLSKMSDVVSNAYSAAAQGTSKAVKIYSMLSDTFSTMNSQFLVVSNYLSNASNYLSNISAFASDAYSAAKQGASQAVLTKTQATAAASRVLLVQSRLSDFDSRLVSDVSDILSAIRGLSDYQSKMSDVVSNAYSAATVNTSKLVKVYSAVNAGAAGLTVSNISDIASAVWAAKYTGNSVASSFGSLLSDVYSRVVKTQSNALAGGSRATKIYSMLSDTLSTMNSQFVWSSNALSDIRSAVGGITVALTPSDISDIASAVAAAATGVTASDLKNIANKVWSDFQSKVGRTVSDVWSDVLNAASDTQSAVALIPKSDGALTFNATAVGNIKAGLATQSNLDSATVKIYSAATATQSRASDIYEIISDVDSALTSQFGVLKANISNLYELASDIDSGILSQFAVTNAAMASKFLVTNSLVSDVQSALDSQFVITNSQLDVNVITVNDTYSLLSAVNSDFQTRVPKLTAPKSQVSDLASDLKSAIGGITVVLTPSDISDMASAVAAATSSKANAIYSLLSDFDSDFQSRVPKLTASSSQVSDLASDLKSALGGITVDGDAIADALLDRDMGAGIDTGDATKRTPRQALRFLRNKWSIAGKTLTITKEDDLTKSWEGSVTTATGADPITGDDPEGP